MADSALRTRVRVVAAAVFEPRPATCQAGDRVPRGSQLDSQPRVLIAQRPPGKHMAGRWEFPGGKVGTGESDLAALRRELHEELGIEAAAAKHCLTLTHDYPDRTVELSMWIVEEYGGEPRALDGQQIKWVAVAELGAEDILEADRPFVEALQAGEAAWTERAARAEQAARAGDWEPS